jgi:transketolase
MGSTDQLTGQAINTIRFLAADAIQAANSGHPGLPMGMAPTAYILWKNYLNFDPSDPKWPNRDRFILSAGHGSMLLYAMLHLTGYDLSLNEIKSFRQWGSETPGHPEYGETPGVETTTGPLGQGFATGVGMALAFEHQAASYNRPGIPLFDHYIYAIVSDGDLMEGVASEAASLAGHLQLGRLIYIYDDNHISIDGNTALTFTEDRLARFNAYGWHTQQVKDGNDLSAIDKAITAAKADARPSIIAVRSIIGFGLPTKAGTAAAHGEPPGEEELEGAKRALDWPLEPSFLIPEEVAQHFSSFADRGRQAAKEWRKLLDTYAESNPAEAEQLQRVLAGDLPDKLESTLPEFPANDKGMATRASSGQTINTLAEVLPEFIGGSADLTGSNKTDIKGEEAFSPQNRLGRYIHFGIREHAMAAMMNGMALYGGLIPYGGTFLVFSDYARPSIRLAALMGLRVIYVFTHDSIGLGEDGPTHQPVEQLAALRAIPNLSVIRPADANETAYSWLAALRRQDGPTALALTRQAVPTLDRSNFSSAKNLLKGAYVLADFGQGEPKVILMASGSEVQFILHAAKELADRDIPTRAVSFPSWELFDQQDTGYQKQVLPDNIKARMAIEAGRSMGWHRWVGATGKVISIDRFGASAPYEEIYQHFGLTVEAVVEQAIDLLDSDNHSQSDKGG